MKMFLRIFALVLWMLSGTILLSRWWYKNPDRFPSFSESFWRYLDLLFGVGNVDDAQNVELFVVISVSFLVVFAVTTVAIAVAHYANRKR